MHGTEAAIVGDVGIGAEVLQVQHGHLAPAKPVGITDFERHRVAEQGQPALGAGRVFSVDEIVDVIENPLQFRLGECPPLCRDRVIGRVSGRVPFKADLAWNIAESAFAELTPAVARMCQVGAEHRHGIAVRAQRLQADRFLAGTQSGQELIYIHRTPLPGKFTCEFLEPFQQLAALLDGLRREPTGQHLCPPAIQHGRENPLIGSKKPNVRIHQHPRDETRNGTTQLQPLNHGNMH